MVMMFSYKIQSKNLQRSQLPPKKRTWVSRKKNASPWDLLSAIIAKGIGSEPD
jgi:hypothetical protein